MSNDFSYRPKFVDIRVKKSGARSSAAPSPREEPSARACDHVDCKQPGEHKAPKGRGHEDQFWWFCLEHASEYNRRWNYFAGMTDAELAEYQKAAEVGHRPTWTFRASKNDQMSATARGKGRKADPFALFGGQDPRTAKEAPRRRLTRLQKLAFEALSLEETADGPTIRARYAEQVKRWHPDSNGGDRTAEARLQKVVQAYQTLKAGGLV